MVSGSSCCTMGYWRRLARCHRPPLAPATPPLAPTAAPLGLGDPGAVGEVTTRDSNATPKPHPPGLGLGDSGAADGGHEKECGTTPKLHACPVPLGSAGGDLVGRRR